MSFGGRSWDEEDDHGGRGRDGHRRRQRDDLPGIGPQPDFNPPSGYGRRPFQDGPRPAPRDRFPVGPAQTATGRVKWYNPEKGYGFVQVDGHAKDPFLHASALEAAGIRDLRPGTTVVCELAETQKGSSVRAIVAVDESTAEDGPARRERPEPRGFQPRVPYQPRAASGPRPVRAPAQAERSVVALVKWYDPVRGFGFFNDPETGTDLFVHASALQAAGLPSLGEGESYRVGVGRNAKGPCVVTVERP